MQLINAVSVLNQSQGVTNALISGFTSVQAQLIGTDVDISELISQAQMLQEQIAAKINEIEQSQQYQEEKEDHYL